MCLTSVGKLVTTKKAYFVTITYLGFVEHGAVLKVEVPGAPGCIDSCEEDFP